MSTIIAQQCRTFQAHVWKKDICANCKRTKEQHHSDKTPSPGDKPACNSRPTQQQVKAAGPTRKAVATSVKNSSKGQIQGLSNNTIKFPEMGKNGLNNTAAASSELSGAQSIDSSCNSIGEKQTVELALKTLSGINTTPASSPHCTRRNGSRTTMNYSTLNNNSNNTKLTSDSKTTVGSSTLDHTTNRPLSSRAGADGQRLSGTQNGHMAAKSSNSRANIPLDKNVSKFSVNREAARNPTGPQQEKATVLNKNNGPDKVRKTSVSKAAGNKVEKRKCIVDKGRLSTEKVILNDSTIVTTSKQSSDKQKSDKPKRTVFVRKDNTSTSVVDKKKCDSNVSTEVAKKPVKSTASKTCDAKQKMDSSVKTATTVKQSRDTTQSSGAYCRSDSSASHDTKQPVAYSRSNSGASVDESDAGKNTVRRSRSRSTRPAAPPPQVPPPGAMASPNKAMAESFHSQVSDAGSQASTQRNSTNANNDDSFSDLYNDIVNSLSSSKDITPDLLMKLKDNKAEDRSSHYYHKYDVTGTTKKKGDLTLSRALGSGTSSIIIETMNTSFHGSVGGGEVDETNTQELAMPYNIVDVTKVPPPKQSPKLPTTPAPEQSSSRNSTLNRNTLKNTRKGALSGESPVRRSESPKSNVETLNLKADSISMDDTLCGQTDGLLQGLPPRYWHTYEPIKSDSNAATRNNSNSKSASVEDILDKCDNDIFMRQSASRATTPAHGGAKPNGSPKPDTNLAHLDLSKPTSRSAENLIDPSRTDKKINNNKRTGSKKDKQSGGFFSRLFGLGRKTSTEESSSEERSPEGVCSLQENAEFFKPLQVDTNVETSVKQASLSPPCLDNTDIVSDIAKALAKTSDQELTINTSADTTGTKPKFVLNTTGNDSADTSQKDNKPIASPRTSFLYANTQPIQKPVKTVSILPESTLDTQACKKVSTSPDSTMDKCMDQSLSQCSLLSDGSSDAKSISSRDDQGSSSDSQSLKSRRPRPKSQSVSRKMLNAPPPPPSIATNDKLRSLSDDKPAKSTVVSTATTKHMQSPTSPTKTSHSFSLKTSQKGKSKRNSTSDDDKRPLSPKRLEISAPIALQSSTLNESQTLPRPVKKVSDNLITESRDDTHMATGRRKKIDSVAKHARNKTVTEGVKVDAVLRHSPESNGDRVKDLTEQRSTSKFMNRALPPTPGQSGLSDNTEVKPRKSVTIQENDRSSYVMNEDIYTDPIEEDDDILSSANHRKLHLSRETLHASQDKLNRPTFNTLKAPANLLADYLEPADSPETRPSFVKPPIAAKPVYGNNIAKQLTNGVPELLPRTSVTPSGKQNGGSETYVSMIYVNTEMIIDKTRPPLDVGDGFRCMAFINVETLLHVANTIQTDYIHQDADINNELKFSHFVLKNTKPYVNQGVVAFYNARTYKLKPSDCLLMISAKYINPDLLHHSCVHMLQPSLIFSDRILATYFPDVAKTTSLSTDPTKSKVYQLGGMVHTNMAVITYHSIQTFESYIKDVIHKKMRLGEPYERLVCYLLFQILNAILSAHDGSSLYTVKSVDLNDIVVVEHTNAKNEPYLVVNPLRSADVERLEDELLCNDLIKILCNFLDIPQQTRGASKQIKGNSRFTAGLKKFVEVLEKNSFSCLLVARSVVEYLLWGPSDKEMKSLLLAEDRGQAFCIWLEVNRCKYVNELALGQLNRNLELSHMFHFLCAVTGSSLLDVTKLLYKYK